MDFNELWCEKYRPKTLNDIILTKEIADFFENIAKQDVKAIPHLMFYGPAGVGKTSLAKLLVNDVLKCEYLYLNGSEQNSIETVRGVITNFIQTRTFDGGMKVVLIDEFDGFSRGSGTGSSAQESLRNIMEEYSPYSRFILTCNHTHKVMEPIWSRVQAFHITPDKKDYLQRCLIILKKEGVGLAPEQVANLQGLINDCYPDLRKCINELQKHSITGKFVMIENSEAIVKNTSGILFNMFLDKRDMFVIRKYVIENEKWFKNDYNMLMKNLFEAVYNSNLGLKQKQNILLAISDAMCDNVIVLDKEINFFALCIRIGNII